MNRLEPPRRPEEDAKQDEIREDLIVMVFEGRIFRGLINYERRKSSRGNGPCWLSSTRGRQSAFDGVSEQQLNEHTARRRGIWERTRGEKGEGKEC